MSRPARGAPRLVATSDVTRFRGVALAALVAAAVAVLAVVGGGRGRAPGPLSASHRAAGVACAGCHTAGRHRPPPPAACLACHAGHASTRAGHAALRARGALGCTTCHGGHRDHGAVTFFADGAARHHDARGARDLPAAGFRPAAAVTVPLVAARACTGCHDPRRAPLAACLAGDVAVCFDEHRAVRAADGTLAGRDLAWEAARAVAATTPPRPARRDDGTGPWTWLALAGVAAALTVTVATRRRPPPPAAPADAPAPPPTGRRLPVIDATTCLGCHACVEACPYDVLEVRRYVAVVARPDACCGLTLCAQLCPNQALTMRDVDGAPPPTAGRATLEVADQPGLFVVGDAGGGALIRNAVDEGARAVATIAARPRPPRDARDALDVLIIGAGPAGLAAALEAQARGLRALTLEQGTVAGSVQSFPRGKLVLDHAAADAPPPRLWLAEATKEELLARWTLALRTARPPIEEGRRVTALARAADGGWLVDSVAADGAAGAAGDARRHRAAAVVIAVGRRGSPRRLDVAVPPTMAAQVHYALADAASFAGRRVLIVGLGDVAMEAAIALSRQPGTTVVVSYRGADLRRGRARNIDELRRRVAAGAVQVVWQSEVRALGDGGAVLTTPAGPHAVACDAVFVLIGAAAGAASPGAQLLARLTRPGPPP